MIIATLKLTLLTVVFISKNKTKFGKVKICTHIRGGWQNILKKKITPLLAKQGKPLRPAIYGTVSLQMEF
jgi:hypothetical protein